MAILANHDNSNNEFTIEAHKKYTKPFCDEHVFSFREISQIQEILFYLCLFIGK